MPSYQTIAIKDNGDWNLQVVKEGQEAILQLLKMRLNSLKGSNVWNIEDGIDPRFLSIDNLRFSQLVQNLQDIILGTAGITEATILQEQATFKNGVLAIPFEFRTIEEENLAIDNFVVQVI